MTPSWDLLRGALLVIGMLLAVAIILHLIYFGITFAFYYIDSFDDRKRLWFAWRPVLVMEPNSRPRIVWFRWLECYYDGWDGGTWVYKLPE